MNRRKAVFCLFQRILRRFDCFQQIFSLFNELSGCLDLFATITIGSTPHRCLI